MSSTLITLRELISEQLFPLPASFGDESDLYLEGLDSMALMQLILLLEESFSICLEPADLGRENFQSLRSIEDLILKKQTL